MTAADLLAFRARFPWLTGDLQTVRNTALDRLGQGPKPPAGAPRRLEIPCKDGTGDRLLALLDEPARSMAATGGGAAADGLVLLLHGLTGCEDSPYMRATARLLVQAGRRVVRLNLRGAGPSRATCGQHYHAGRGGDVAIAIAGLAAAGIGEVRVAVGYSLGASILLNHLADVGTATPLKLAMAVSAPLDLMATSICMQRPRNRVYQAAILADMKRELRGSAAPEALTAAALKSRTVRGFDNALIAPWNGFGTVERYYSQCSAAPRLGAIGVDTLLVHAADDPWIPLSMYRAVDWAGL
ncbi:MAG: alpha/beta fold hydrolase, partial [Rhodospirillaceae bacterium]|nr:alpha/beta fold hydrolase [Rhodospirillaceae bacterium]